MLPGSYAIHDDSRGTVPASGDPYAAIGSQVAVFGLGTMVTGYDARLGTPRWTAELSGLPPGWQIVSVRVWPGVITVDAAGPPPDSAAQAPSGPLPAAEREAVLDASTGRLIRWYPSVQFGGAVAADARHTVVAGPGAVTSYDNRTGRVVWSAATGAAPQRWQLDGRYLYVTVAADGYLGPAPVTALRKINLSSGSERVVRPRSASFAGTLSAALDGVVLFTGPAGVTAYSGGTGRGLWHAAGAVAQTVDVVAGRFYLAEGAALVGVDRRGHVVSRLSGSSGIYGERDGVAFGLDQGAGGQVWGVDVASQHVMWSTTPLPWPHVFVDLSGLGGSTDPRAPAIVLAACGQANLDASPPQCTKPELVVVDR